MSQTQFLFEFRNCKNYKNDKNKHFPVCLADYIDEQNHTQMSSEMFVFFFFNKKDLSIY